MIDSETAMETKPMVKTQAEWKAYFGKQGKRMILPNDIYHCKDEMVLASLRKDFEESWVITGATIKDGHVIEKVKWNKANVEHIRNAPFTQFQSGFINESQLSFLQALFDTEDDYDTIKKRLQEINGKDQIWVWNDKGAAGFYCNNRGFHINGNIIINQGRSRGVKE